MDVVSYLTGAVSGAGVVLGALLWRGVRQLDAERQRLVERRERMRP